MNKILDNLDQFLLSQKESEQKLFFFLPLLIFGFLSYYFLYPITDSNLIQAQKQNKSLEKKISNVKMQNVRYKNENVKLKTILVKADRVLKKLNNDKSELDKLLKKLSFLKFDLEKWAKFFNAIPIVAKKYNLTIIKLDNEANLENQTKLVNKNIELEIKAIGSFVDFMKFINYFESQKELIKIKNIKIDNNEIDLVIEIYGAKL